MTIAEIKRLLKVGETRFVLASGNVWAIVRDRATRQPIFGEQDGDGTVLAQRWEQTAQHPQGRRYGAARGLKVKNIVGVA